jgi:hypothetical protein
LLMSVADQFFSEGFQDQLEEEEEMTLGEFIRPEGEQKREEIFSIQYQIIFASSNRNFVSRSTCSREFE